MADQLLKSELQIDDSMLLTQREVDKLLASWAAEVARRRKAKSVRLNHPEAVAILTDYILESAREGKDMADIIFETQNLLAEEDVMEGIADMIDVIQVEATFRDGTKLVTVREPIKSKNHLEWIRIKDGKSIIDTDVADSIELSVTNSGDRPIQVGSHFHFFESNNALKFERSKAFGKVLDIPSGTSVRFEPGSTRKVKLRNVKGKRVVTGLNGLTQGSIDETRASALKRAAERGFA